jgi:HlyD family secretion protein
VITRNVDPGQTVASLLQSPLLFLVATDLQHLRVIAAVDEADIGDVKQGQRATFTVNAYPDRVFDGVVTEVRNSPVIVQDVVTYGVVVTVDNADLSLRPGMTAAVHVRTAAASDTLRVPSAALHFTPPGVTRERGKGTVFVLENGAIVPVPVTAGVSDVELTAVSQGPQVGTQVLVDLTPEGSKAYGLTTASL